MRAVQCGLALAVAMAIALAASAIPARAAGAEASGEVRSLADPAALDAYKAILKRVKPTSDKQAELIKTLTPEGNLALGAEPTPPAINMLGFSTDDGSQMATTAIVVPTPDVLTTNLTLMLTNSEGEVIDINSQESSDETPITLTVGPGANKGSGAVEALATVHVIYKSGGSDVLYGYSKGAVFPTGVVNLAPVITKDATSNTWIQVCIDRATPSTAKAPACNYVFGSVPKPPGALIPVQGSIKYPGPVEVDAKGKPKNAEATLIILNGDTEAACRYVDLGARFLADRNTKAAGDTLTWSLDPAVFASTCPEPMAFYTFALAVKVNVGGEPAWGTISNAVNASTKTSIAIPRLQVAAGCIAAGTPITLASGETKPVEALAVGDKLKSQTHVLALAAVASGNDTRVVTISTDGGEHVTVSLIHPVVTERGDVQARDLRLDDVLTTPSGKAKIVKLVQEVLPQPIKVYDLVLTPPPGSTAQGSTLYAGDLLVGDGAMKAALIASRQ